MNKPSINIKIGAILCAAGLSSRLGKSKQLLKYDGETLLVKTYKMVTNVVSGPTMVVLSEDKEIIAEAITNELPYCINLHPEEGMSGSIILGLKTLLLMDPSLDAALISVCDQIFLSEKILSDVCSAYKSQTFEIIRSKYEDGQGGPPVIFGRKYFDALALISGDHGGKNIVKQHQDDVLNISFPMGHIDIDQPEDLKWLK